MNEYHCLKCQRDRHAKFFMIWIADKTKSRRCDSCQNDPTVKQRVIDSKKERDAKPSATSDTPQLVGLSKMEIAQQKCKVRDGIADIKAMRDINDFVGI